VRPDTYTLKITLENFQSAEQKGLVVNANDRIMAGNFVLAIGQMVETVTVVAQSSDIQLKGGERAFTNIGVGVSPDGKTVLYRASVYSGKDLMLIENFR
jgi:hypothetical protein